MKEWQVEVAVFTTGKTMYFTLLAENLTNAKVEALKEIRKIVHNRKNLYLEAKCKQTYTIVSDLYDVGLVSLKCVTQEAIGREVLT